MKQFYFVKGEKISKLAYELNVNLLEENNILNSMFNQKFYKTNLLINGEMIDLEDRTEEFELPIPQVYSDKEQIAIEVPNFYEYYCITFLNNNVLKIQTSEAEYDFSLKDFGKAPINMRKNNGILIFT